MKKNSARLFFGSASFLLGFSFLIISLYAKYDFYHMNSFKLLSLGVAVTGLFAVFSIRRLLNITNGGAILYLCSTLTLLLFFISLGAYFYNFPPAKLSHFYGSFAVLLAAIVVSVSLYLNVRWRAFFCNKDAYVYLIVCWFFVLVISAVAGVSLFDSVNHSLMADKIVFFLLIVALLLWSVCSEPIANKSESLLQQRWPALLVVSTPLLATIPGYLINGGQVNYNFSYEWVAFIALLLWSALLINYVNTRQQVQQFLGMVGFGIILVGLISLLEKFGIVLRNIQFTPYGLSTHDVFIDAPERVGKLMGNVNYLAGYLILLIPVFIALALPNIVSVGGSNKRANKKNTQTEMRSHSLLQRVVGGVRIVFGDQSVSEKPLSLRMTSLQRFFSLVAVFGLLALLLTLTRTALVGFAGSLALVFLLLVLSSGFSKAIKRRIFLILGAASLIILLFLAVLYQFKTSDVDQSSQSNHSLSNVSVPSENSSALSKRFESILDGSAWGGRTMPWYVAVDSIKSAPIFGYGLGSSYNLFFEFVTADSRIKWAERSYNHAHNEILEYVQEGGLFGLFVFLMLWALLIYILIRNVFQHEEPFWRRLAIGILCGFAAYHFQSIFSVAPRMIVTRLPLYTLIALTLCMPIFPGRKWLSSNKLSHLFAAKPNSAIGVIIIGVMIAMFWLAYGPWAKSQYRHVKALGIQNPQEKVALLKSLTNDYPNAYAHYDLLVHQVRSPQTSTDDIKRMVLKTESIIKNYREARSYEAVFNYRDGHYDLAKEKARSYKKLDEYHYTTNLIMAKIAAASGDQELFADSLQSMLELWVVTAKLEGISSVDNVHVLLSGSSDPRRVMDISVEPSSFKIQLDEQFVEFLLMSAKRVAQYKDSDRIDQQVDQFKRSLFAKISEVDYFPFSQRSKNTEISHEERSVLQNLRRYYNLQGRIGQMPRGNQRTALELELSALNSKSNQLGGWKKMKQREELRQKLVKWCMQLVAPNLF